MRAVKPGLMGPWLADFAGNFLAITIIVLIVVSRYEPNVGAAPAPMLLRPAPVAPLGGIGAVEMLRQRLLESSAIAAIDLTPHAAGLPGDLTRPVVLFILHPARHAEVSERLTGLGHGWQELTVPEALKTANNQWQPGFLKLALVASDQDAFLDGLQALLVAGHTARGGGLVTGRDVDHAPETILSKLARWLVVGKNLASLMLLGLFLLGFLGVRRWSLKG